MRATLGQTSCVAVDDCTAPFPPAGADVVVSKAAPPPAVSTIAEALAKVPAHGTIAIDAGTYVESITLTQDVHLVGRCAGKVIVSASGLRGVYASGYFSADLRSLTIDGGTGGVVAGASKIGLDHVILLNNEIAVLAGYGGQITMSSSLIDGGGQANDATSGNGAVVVMSGSLATLDDVEVRNFSPAFVSYDKGSKLTVTRSLASYLGPAATSQLMSAWTGSSLVVRESAVSTREAGLLSVGASFPGVSGPPANVEFVSSELAQTGYNRTDVLMGVGGGASATLDDTTIHHQAYFGLFVSGPGSTAKVKGSVIRGEPTFDVVRTAVQVGMGASAELDDTAIVSAIQAGLVAGDSGSSLTLERVLVRGTSFVGPGPNSRLMGSGIALGVGSQAKLTLADTSLVENQQFGLYVGTGTVAEVTGLLVDATIAAPVSGAGIAVESGGQLALTGGVLRNSAESAVACAAGGVVVGASQFVGNKVALAVDSKLVLESSDAPAMPSASTIVLYQDEYTGNGALRGPPPSYLPGP
jgi:hypothetical protein